MNNTALLQQAKTASISPPRKGVLQRKCACGKKTMASGECSECAKKKRSLQRKIAIGASNDPLEHEADRVANIVTSNSSRSVNLLETNRPIEIQRHSFATSENQSETPDSVDKTISQPGRTLDSQVQNDMEKSFGFDFSNVRIHTDTLAQQSSHEVEARAIQLGTILHSARGSILAIVMRDAN